MDASRYVESLFPVWEYLSPKLQASATSRAVPRSMPCGAPWWPGSPVAVPRRLDFMLASVRSARHRVAAMRPKRVTVHPGASASSARRLGGPFAMRSLRRCEVSAPSSIAPAIVSPLSHTPRTRSNVYARLCNPTLWTQWVMEAATGSVDGVGSDARRFGLAPSPRSACSSWRTCRSVSQGRSSRRMPAGPRTTRGLRTRVLFLSGRPVLRHDER